MIINSTRLFLARLSMLNPGAAGWSGNADRIAAESAFISEVAIQKREVKNND